MLTMDQDVVAMSPSQQPEPARNAWRPWRLVVLNVAGVIVLALGSLLPPRWFLFSVLLVTFGNVIGIVMLSPTLPDEPEAERQRRSVR